jgi:lipoyl(octanoyl) transferase
MKSLLVASLGVVPYAQALEMQRAAAKARIDGSLPNDLLLLVQHPPVITTGRSTDHEHLLANEAMLNARGVELFDVERGGDVTFHGPGQLVGYPIMDLRQHKEDLHWYLRQLERALISALIEFGLVGEQRAGLTGVWTNGRKIASIGVHARSWVTWHGFALNVTTDLSYFELIVPCGIDQVHMTSIERELGGTASPDLVAKAEIATVRAFADAFGLSAEALPEAEFSAALFHSDRQGR